MARMAAFEFADIILVPFPCTDQSTTKQRPAVVICSQTFHALRPDLALWRDESAPGVRLEWRAASLIEPSAIKPDLATIKRDLSIERWFD